jgi:ribonuclease HI
VALFKNELSDFANKIINLLKQHDLFATFDDASFKDYLVQLSIKNKLVSLGKINIYYKPSKKSYSLVNSNIKNEDDIKTINKCWDLANGFETHAEDSGIYEAFVDGSYINGKTGCGAVIFLGNKKIKEISKNIADTSTRQFGGELCAVIEVINWCKGNNVKKLRINYDYLGIEYFANGKWKAKNKLAQEYTQIISSSDIDILWRKIESHTGNTKNDIADKLAKAGAMS